MAAKAASASPRTETAIVDPTKIVCRKIDQTGSRLGGKKVCMTAAQWEVESDNSKDYVRDKAKVPMPSG